MALLYIDGFDHYTNTSGADNHLYDLAPELWALNGSGSQNINNINDTDVMPELGGRGLRVMWKNSSTLTAPMTTSLRAPFTVTEGLKVGIGFHLYMEHVPGTSSNNFGIIGLGSTDYNCSGGGLGIAESGQLTWNPTTIGSTPLITSAEALTSGSLYHIELQIYFHNTEGWVECRVNGVTFFRLEDVDTIQGSQTRLVFCPKQSTAGNTISTYCWYKNLYIYDGSGSVNTDWLGERNVFTLPVDGDSSPQDWVLSSGSDAYDLLDNIPPDALNDYIESTSVGDISKFTVTDLSTLDISILGVQTTIQGYKTGTSDTTVDVGVDVNGETDLGTVVLVQDQPQYFWSISELSPDTGQPYLPTELQGALLHIERSL